MAGAAPLSTGALRDEPSASEYSLDEQDAARGVALQRMISREHVPHPAHHSPESGAGPAARRSVMLVLALTLTFTAVEFIGGLVTGSLALLADSGHMLSDAGSLALAAGAMWLATRPATPDRSFGYRRAEVLAALVNGATLVAIAVWIFVAAARRLGEPPDILAGGMLAVAAAGLAVNVLGIGLLWRARGQSLNIRAAFRHVAADLLGSVGAITASLIVLLTGWVIADAIVSVIIGALLLAGSWAILRDAVWILLEASPQGVDARAVAAEMDRDAAVLDVHDLHIWTITSGFPALSAHVVARLDANCDAVRRRLEGRLAERFRIRHSTLQVESAHDLAAGDCAGCDAAARLKSSQPSTA